MPDISKITVNNTTYNVKDETAREAVQSIATMEASFAGTALVFTEGSGTLPNAEEVSF